MVLVPVVVVLGLPVTALGLIVGLGLDAASHYLVRFAPPCTPE
ncbi:hypothetical protein ACWC4C_13685 [Streptomyces olivaceoviridis]